MDEKDQKIEYKMHNSEGKDYLQYEWIDLKQIDNYNLLPICLKNILKVQEVPPHIINEDIINNKNK